MATKYLVLDVETAGNVKSNPCTYDVAWSISDSKGAIIVERRFIVSEIFNNNSLMDTAYYAKKIPTHYTPAIERGEVKVVPLQTVRLQLAVDMLEHKVDTIYTYNAKFDSHALNNTIRKCSNEFVKEFLPGIEYRCIWGYAQDIMGCTTTYVNWCIQMGYLNENGTPSTTAEIMYRYIARDTAFVEAHTALEDVRIETKILHYLRKHHGPKAGSWKCYSRWRKLREIRDSILAQ